MGNDLVDTDLDANHQTAIIKTGLKSKTNKIQGLLYIWLNLSTASKNIDEYK